MTKESKIRCNKDINRLFNKDNRKYFPGILVFITDNNLSYSRFLISIKKKAGNGVLRNKLKRRLKYILSIVKNNISYGYDLAFIIKKNFSYFQLQENINFVLENLNILL